MRCASSTTTRSHSDLASSAWQVLVARELIHPRDQQRVLLERRLAPNTVCSRLRGQDLEREPELQIQLVLPLLDQAAGGDDQAALDVVAQDQLLDVEPGHDRLAGAWVVGEQEPQRRARQQLAVDRAHLVGQRLDVRRRDRQHRVEQARELDPLALGDELEVGGVSVEGTRLELGDRELLLGVATEDALAELALSGLVRQLDRIGPVRLHGDDRDVLPGNHASKTQARLEILKLATRFLSGRPYRVRRGRGAAPHSTPSPGQIGRSWLA